MDERGKSDDLVVPAKLPNNARGGAAEVAEGRGSPEGNAASVSFYLKRWAGKKYKRPRTDKRFQRWWKGLQTREPGLFAHWRWVRSY
jgi:hypothetical protein